MKKQLTDLMSTMKSNDIDANVPDGELIYNKTKIQHHLVRNIYYHH